MAIDPRISAPAPGLPALLNRPDAEFTLEVEFDGDPLGLAGWAAELALADRHGRIAPLGVIATSIHDSRGSLCRATLRVRPSVPLPCLSPRTASVWSIVRDGKMIRRHAVAVMAESRELRVLFASDLHVAVRWDHVDEAIARHLPSRWQETVHPNRLMEEFVARANHMAARGELDLVVLGGDLIDFLYVLPRDEVERGHRETNIDRLLSYLSNLDVPFVTIPGNHDYRLFPWRLRAYGLSAIGLTSEETELVLRASGWWDGWRLQPSDTDALRCEIEGHEPPLEHYRRELAPHTCFHLDVRGIRLIFADTGRDAFNDWQAVEPERRWLMTRALRHGWLDPDSEGLSDSQADSVVRALESCTNAAVFVHAPLFHPRPRLIPEGFSLHLPDSDDAAAQAQFEHALLDTGQRGGVIFRNSSRLLKGLLFRKGAACLIAGHVHKATNVAIDKRTLHARAADFRAPESADDCVSVVTSPSLGHFRRVFGEGPGYVSATFRDGQLTRLERQSILQPHIE